VGIGCNFRMLIDMPIYSQSPRIWGQNVHFHCFLLPCGPQAAVVCRRGKEYRKYKTIPSRFDDYCFPKNKLLSCWKGLRISAHYFWDIFINMFLCQTPYLFFGTGISTNFTFGVWMDYITYQPANDKLSSKGAWPRPRDRLLNFGTPPYIWNGWSYGLEIW